MVMSAILPTAQTTSAIPKSGNRTARSTCFWGLAPWTTTAACCCIAPTMAMRGRWKAAARRSPKRPLAICGSARIWFSLTDANSFLSARKANRKRTCVSKTSTTQDTLPSKESSLTLWRATRASWMQSPRIAASMSVPLLNLTMALISTRRKSLRMTKVAHC